jgi:hypothetical protein
MSSNLRVTKTGYEFSLEAQKCDSKRIVSTPTFSLTRVSAELWRYLETPKTCAQLRRKGGDLVMEHLRELCKKGLVKIDTDGLTFSRRELVK